VAGTAPVAGTASSGGSNRRAALASAGSPPGYYLALGDSVAFGYRPPQVTTVAQYENADNFVGYPTDVGAAENLVTVNASCPGETTSSMLSVTAQSNGCENSVGSPVGYRTAFPLHVAYSGSQMAYAVQFLQSHPTTRLVTIDIGANDAFICEATSGTDGCTTSAALSALEKTITTNMKTIFSDLRNEAGYHGPIVTLDYYSTNYADATTNAQSELLNSVINGPTVAAGGIVANGYSAFEAAAAPYGGNACAAGLLVKLPGGTCNIHPTAYGHQLLARAIEQALAAAGVQVANPPGYRLAAADGGLFDFGANAFDGSGSGSPATASSDVVGVAEVPGGGGYWMATAAGSVLAFGDAPVYSAPPAGTFSAPVVGIAADPNGGGYWLVTADGGVYSFGAAPFSGSMAGRPLAKPVVGMAAAPYGGGYWLVASDGGVFAFGTASFDGSTGAITLNKPVVGMAATPDGGGYWLVASDGGVFAFGNAPFDGSTGAIKLNKPVVAMAATPDGGGYWLVASDGGVFAFGEAPFEGSMGGVALAKPVVAMTTTG